MEDIVDKGDVPLGAYNWSWLGLFGLAVIVYYFVQLVLWMTLDSDIELFWKSKFGVPIKSMKGRVVWVTGASSGIGKHLAIVLAKNGVRMCISARREEELLKIKDYCLLASGGSLKSKDIMVLKMDMLEIADHEVAFNEVLDFFGGHIDVLVQNAGRSQRANWQDIALSVDRDMFELNVFSVVNLSRIYARHVESKGIRGHIAVTSSVAGLLTAPGSASYNGAKHAIHGYFESLPLDFPHIDVTLFCPGPTSTEFLQNCFTNQPGSMYGQSVKPTDRRMTSERCAALMATAIANKTHVNFVGVFPVPLLVYISLYYPNIKTLIIKMLGGAEGLKKIRDSKTE